MQAKFVAEGSVTSSQLALATGGERQKSPRPRFSLYYRKSHSSLLYHPRTSNLNILAESTDQSGAYRWWSGLLGADASRDTSMQKRTRENWHNVRDKSAALARADFSPIPAPSPLLPGTAYAAAMSLVRLLAVAGVRGAVLVAGLPRSSGPFPCAFRCSTSTTRCFDRRNEMVQVGQTPPPQQQSTNTQ